MGRHTIINPATGRAVLKTGALGRKIQKTQKQKKTKPTKKASSKPKTSKASKASKSYHGPFATKRASPMWKSTNQGHTRPSARAMYDAGCDGPVYYNGKTHVMDFRANGSPYYRPLKCGTKDCATGA